MQGLKEQQVIQCSEEDKREPKQEDSDAGGDQGMDQQNFSLAVLGGKKKR